MFGCDQLVFLLKIHGVPGIHPIDPDEEKLLSLGGRPAADNGQSEHLHYVHSGIIDAVF